MLGDLKNYLNGIRRDFADQSLSELSVDSNPFKQFKLWFEEAVNSQILDPYAMSISTVSGNGQPSIRVVYLRDIIDQKFVFYTNYNSRKGKDLSYNQQIALHFYWAELSRQIIIEGVAKKIQSKVSDKYFSHRPRESQIGAWASSQSKIIKDRVTLNKNVKFYTEKFKNQKVPRPDHWGGFSVQPFQIEFWQGRPNRLHDRIVYEKEDEHWLIKRIAP